MTVAELIEELKKQDPNMEVTMTVDGRGGHVNVVRQETYVSTVVDLWDERPYS